MINNYSVLIVEDEYLSACFLKEVLTDIGVKEIFIVDNANDAKSAVRSAKIDFCFMDINIKGSMDGISCAIMLNQEYKIPVIFTTAYNDSATIDEASETNIYGYLIKPFDSHDIEATVKILLKKLPKKDSNKNLEDSNKKQLNENCYYCYQTNQLVSKNNSIKLTNKESMILELLIKNIDKTVTYELLRQSVWGDKEIKDSTIRDSISRLRKKTPCLNFENISSLGYKLKSN